MRSRQAAGRRRRLSRGTNMRKAIAPSSILAIHSAMRWSASPHYDGARLVHGEAVAIGMACAFRFSVRRGLCGEDDRARVEAHLQNVGLPVRIVEIPGLNTGAGEIIGRHVSGQKGDAWRSHLYPRTGNWGLLHRQIRGSQRDTRIFAKRIGIGHSHHARPRCRGYTARCLACGRNHPSLRSSVGIFRSIGDGAHRRL